MRFQELICKNSYKNAEKGRVMEFRISDLPSVSSASLRFGFRILVEVRISD